MYIFVCVLTVLCNFIFAAEINSVCKTPNGETGTCIPIESCTVIKKDILTFLHPTAVQFAKDSSCGYKENLLVCCGSIGHPTTPALESRTPEPEFFPEPESFLAHVNYSFLPDKSLCGLQITEDRNSTANVAEIDEFPWLAVMKYVNPKLGNEIIQCAGTLISNRYIVTAASCLDLPGLKLHKIRLGDWNLNTYKDCDSKQTCTIPQDYDIAEQIQHPLYEKLSGDNNIALIRLKERVKYTDFVRAICLPSSDHPSDGGAQVEVSTWGPGNAQKLKLKLQRYIMSAESCALSYPRNKNINAKAGCYTSQSNSPKCAFEDGSSLMRTYVKSDSLDVEQFYLEGIAYNGRTSDRTGEPCLYTRASKYTEWIAQNLKP